MKTTDAILLAVQSQRPQDAAYVESLATVERLTLENSALTNDMRIFMLFASQMVQYSHETATKYIVSTIKTHITMQYDTLLPSTVKKWLQRAAMWTEQQSLQQATKPIKPFSHDSPGPT